MIKKLRKHVRVMTKSSRKLKKIIIKIIVILKIIIKLRVMSRKNGIAQ